jgi:hypothetical protein
MKMGISLIVVVLRMVKWGNAAIVAAAMALSGLAHGKDVQIWVPLAWSEPADIAIHSGDRVIWQIPPETTLSVRDLEGNFDSGILGIGERAFDHVYPLTGFFGYETVQVEPFPPYREVSYGYRSRGMVEVITPEPRESELMLNAPISGGIFPLPVDSDGTVSGGGAWLPLQASAAATNALQQIEYRFAGETIGVSTNWPFRLLAQTFVIGTNSVIATAVYEDGRRITSLPREVIVRPMLFSRGGVFLSAQRLRAGFSYVEYMTAGGGPWLLRLVSGFHPLLPDPPPTSSEFNLRGVHGGWGRFPMPTTKSQEFLYFDRRF